MACARTVRAQAASLLDVELVESEIAQFHGAFPELAAALVETVSAAHLTGVLRNLLEEEVSIRNLRAIAERIVAYDEIAGDWSKFIVFDDRQQVVAGDGAARLAGCTQHARTGLKRYLSHKYTRGQNTLLVYLLDPDFDAQLAAAGDNDALTGAIRAAVREELGAAPATLQSPVILTTTTLRARLRRLLAPEFPRLAVLCYEELSPDLNIQPLARLSPV
jgi:type III secretion protein V